MGSFQKNCEIVEENDVPSSTPRLQAIRDLRRRDLNQDQKPTITKKGSNKSLEDDINKLFESVNLRESKSLDLSQFRRNSSKEPMKVSGSHSSGIGFSEQVSLKQALRGLCISQAAEMAAMKRLSMTSASPRISEASRITNLYRSVVEAGKSECLITKDGKPGTNISLVPEKTTPSSSEIAPCLLQDSAVKLLSPIPDSSIGVKMIVKDGQCASSRSSGQTTEFNRDNVQSSFVEKTAVCSAIKLPQKSKVPKIKYETQSSNSSSVGSSLAHGNAAAAVEADAQLLEKVGSVEETQNTRFVLPQKNAHCNLSKPDKKISGSKKVACEGSSIHASSFSLSGKREPNLRNVASSSLSKHNRASKLTRSSSRAVKEVPRKKVFVMKKSKKLVIAAYANRKKSYEGNGGINHGLGQLICQKCHCSLKDSNRVLPVVTSSESILGSKSGNESKLNCIKTGREDKETPVVKTNTSSKFSEKGDFFQSSISSICDFSSSTTSISDESFVNGSICGNKPHMSRDKRWKAINQMGKHGFLSLSHFNLLKKLGSGDIGTVYLAQLMGTEYLFAIKVMDNEFLARRKKMPRSHVEREILQMLDHPFLPTLYAQFTSENLSCLVMEFCPGGDLHVLRQKQPDRYFLENEARFYVAEVLLALEYLHMLGIVYRDLKPENVLVRKDGHIMLTDFDLSLRCSVSPTLVESSLASEPPRVSGPCAGSNCIDPFCSDPSCQVSCFRPRKPSTAKSRKMKNGAAKLIPQLVAEPTEARSNSFVGTHEYLAPEIIKGKGHGSAVDWWTFGVFLYELLYGKTPFKGAGNDETLANVVMQKLEFPDTPIVSFQARDLIRGLLVKDPAQRFGTETGAAEIKRHSFFEGVNWALIRNTVPPEIPGGNDAGNFRKASVRGIEKKYEDCCPDGRDLEFELF